MSKTDKHGFITDFDWKLYPKIEQILHKEVNTFLKNNNAARKLARDMEKRTATRFFDWVDHIVIPESKLDAGLLEKSGFQEISGAPDGCTAFKHFGAAFFPIILSEKTTEVALKPEDIDAFAKARGIKKIEGEKFGSYRRAQISNGLCAVERRGYCGFLVRKDKDVKEYKEALRTFAARKRKFDSDREGMDYTEELVRKTLRKLSKPRTADAFFRNERLYWQAKNRIGKFQRERQDSLGLGWGNHDHHTYRSSRDNFRQLVSIFEKMGYLCRERFYAGQAAGWGAQILEHPECDIVIFADVDITNEERETDFAHKKLGGERKLGTVGLWIALHGESMLQAGMHHLEARFDFDLLKKQLDKKGLGMMKPFSYFDFLKQAFTAGEIWKVEKRRLDALLSQNLITKEQHDIFLKNGALGSHLENLMRTQGFKGFNQDSVTAIIKATDPRNYMHKDYHSHRPA